MVPLGNPGRGVLPSIARLPRRSVLIVMIRYGGWCTGGASLGIDPVQNGPELCHLGFVQLLQRFS